MKANYYLKIYQSRYSSLKAEICGNNGVCSPDRWPLFLLKTLTDSRTHLRFESDIRTTCLEWDINWTLDVRRCHVWNGGSCTYIYRYSNLPTFGIYSNIFGWSYFKLNTSKLEFAVQFLNVYFHNQTHQLFCTRGWHIVSLDKLNTTTTTPINIIVMINKYYATEPFIWLHIFCLVIKTRPPTPF